MIFGDHYQFNYNIHLLAVECSVHVGLCQVPVGPPSEVEEIFDAISYSKGSCVIRMLHDWIGVEVMHWSYWRFVIGGKEEGHSISQTSCWAK